MPTMPGFFSNLRNALQDRRRGRDMRFLCDSLLSERGEASQTALAAQIISTYRTMTANQRLGFFKMLCDDFSPDPTAVGRTAAEYQRAPGEKTLAALAAAVEAPRQELIRRINTAPGGTETLVTLREHVLASTNGKNFDALDSDLKHLFRSWFNRGFLRLERISWHTPAHILEKLMRYESVHEINGWPDLRRRLEADRRCFAFFHPALDDEPIIFVEVALAHGLTGDLEPLLDIHAPVLDPEKADTAIFYSINNCLKGLRNVPFGNFLIKQVVAELAAEFSNLRSYSTLSPLPRFAEALRAAKPDRGEHTGRSARDGHETHNEGDFTPERMSRLLADFAPALTAAAGRRDAAAAFFHLLEKPLAHREALSAPLERLALAYLTKAERDGKLYDPVATFHLSNGARLERINAFGNLRAYGIASAAGVTVNYRYLPEELEENHERFVREGEIRVSTGLFKANKAVAAAWRAQPEPAARPRERSR